MEVPVLSDVYFGPSVRHLWQTRHWPVGEQILQNNEVMPPFVHSQNKMWRKGTISLGCGDLVAIYKLQWMICFHSCKGGELKGIRLTHIIKLLQLIRPEAQKEGHQFQRSIQFGLFNAPQKKHAQGNHQNTKARVRGYNPMHTKNQKKHQRLP